MQKEKGCIGKKWVNKPLLRQKNRELFSWRRSIANVLPDPKYVFVVRWQSFKLEVHLAKLFSGDTCLSTSNWYQNHQSKLPFSYIMTTEICFTLGEKRDK